MIRLKLARRLFETDGKPMQALVFSPSRNEYQILDFLDYMLDRWNDHIQANDDDLRLVACHQEKERLEIIKADMKKKRQERIYGNRH